MLLALVAIGIVGPDCNWEIGFLRIFLPGKWKYFSTLVYIANGLHYDSKADVLSFETISAEVLNHDSY